MKYRRRLYWFVAVIYAALWCSHASFAQKNVSQAALTFDEIDPIAIAVLNQAQQLSFKNGVEYCGFIALDTLGALRATAPARGLIDQCSPDAPDDWTLIASYHTHGSVDLTDLESSFELPSSDDIESDHLDEVNGYIATPGGRLWFVDGHQKIAYLIQPEGFMMTDPNYQSDDCTLYQSYTINELRYLETDGFIECDDDHSTKSLD